MIEYPHGRRQRVPKHPGQRPVGGTPFDCRTVGQHCGGHIKRFAGATTAAFRPPSRGSEKEPGAVSPGAGAAVDCVVGPGDVGGAV
jgi:hypothetical protein